MWSGNGIMITLQWEIALTRREENNNLFVFTGIAVWSQQSICLVLTWTRFLSSLVEIWILGLSGHNYIVIIWFPQNLCQSKCPMRKQVQLSFSFPSSETDNQRNSYLYSLSVKLLVKTIFSSPPTTYFAKFQDFRNKTKAVVVKPCQHSQSTPNIPTNIW